MVSLFGASALWHIDRVNAQSGGWGRSAYEGLEFSNRTVFPDNRFIFCRLRYTSYGEHPAHNIGGRWSIDYPDSDEHFSWRISELTTLNVPRDANGEFEHAVVSITDDKIFDYPFTYLIEPGELVFSEEEVENLRRYLLRGGFMMVDDFWGEAEWTNWEAEISRVFDPIEYPMEELDISHPIFHMVFDLEEKPQVPTPWFWVRSGGQTNERFDSDVVHYKGIHDKSGRLMVVVCHNTDLGDGWEREGMDKGYFEEVSVKMAYPMGINIVVYAMTH